MTAMQHVCAWVATEDERFQVCDCGLWRWDPAYSDRAAIEAHRRVENPPRTLSRPISATFTPKTTNDARPTEGNVA